jgi:hypothetical protein
VKVVVNRSVGASFCLTRNALGRVVAHKGAAVDAGARLTAGQGPEACSDQEIRSWSCRIARDDADLVRAVEELGSAAAGLGCELAVVEIPDLDAWRISDVVGYEFVVVDGKIY